MKTRAHVQLVTNQQAVEFVSLLNSDGTANKYTLENLDGSFRVEARSLLGVLYFITEHGDEIFLVNETDNTLPNWIDKFRA